MVPQKWSFKKNWCRQSCRIIIAEEEWGKKRKLKTRAPHELD